MRLASNWLNMAKVIGCHSFWLPHIRHHSLANTIEDPHGGVRIAALGSDVGITTEARKKPRPSTTWKWILLTTWVNLDTDTSSVQTGAEPWTTCWLWLQKTQLSHAQASDGNREVICALLMQQQKTDTVSYLD